MYVPYNELTLSEEEIESFAERLCGAGYHVGVEHIFQSKLNRDAVAKACVVRGAKVKRSRTGNSVLDPRYTVEGELAGLPDKGLANDSVVGNFYKLERTL